VFAAQMIDVTIPATGSSGHIGGGILLAAMIGSFPALLSMAAVILIQCLFFADGGWLAAGANIFNLGVIPCLVAYPLVFKPLVQKGAANGKPSAAKIGTASVAAVVVGLQLGAFGVVFMTLLSGITELPFSTFLLLMQPIHLAIGIMEGIITAAILSFVYKMRPEIMESTLAGQAMPGGVPMRRILVTLALITVCAAGVLSLFVSSNPDGLEWSIEKITGTTELETEHPVMEAAALIQERTAFMPDYDFKDAEEHHLQAGAAVAGISGSVFTFILAGVSVCVISLVKKKQKRAAACSASTST
jgi:cobalt/nickel transport system permease protein